MTSPLRTLADEILTSLDTSGRLVAVDGIDGSGKTSLAAKLAEEIKHRPVVVIHADDFLNPSPVRHARGRTSPEGFWEDSYNYAALREYVLKPLSRDGDGLYRPASYHASTDRTVTPEPVQAPPQAVVLLEGMFLHRDELVGYWDASIFLDVPFTESAARMAIRNGSISDPDHPTMRRYVDGQRLYFEAARPWERATIVVDNTDFAAPRIIPPEMTSNFQ